MEFLKSMAISASGLRAQAGRMRIISENIANPDSTPSSPGADPYRRKVPTFKSEVDRAVGASLVEMGKVPTDSSDSRVRYEPGHPSAERQRQISERQSDGSK
jgi:flagellar basal-body rod protein FlgC